MRVLRASEISSFLYCRRAWWYQVQGVRSENLAELDGGQVVHQRLARRVQRAVWAIRLAYLCFFLAILLLLRALVT